jgi:O-antigen biosynthesis protein
MDVMQNNQRAYRIWAPPYRNRSAGVRCLYRLAALLRERGLEATVNDLPKNLDYVAVYPETVKELNPFGAPHMVRYLLQRPGVVGGPRVYPKKTLKFWYDHIFRGSNQDDPLLTIQTVELDLFNLQGVGTRDTTSTWIGRAERRGYMKGKPVGDTFIKKDWPPTRADVAALLKRSRALYTYEPFTLLTTEAALCGCPSLILTNMARYPISRKELDDLGWVHPGVAWGPEGIEKARETLPSALPGYLYTEERTKAQLTAFVEITQNM